MQELGQNVADLVRHYWGFDELRPLQSQAIAAALAGRDSLVVMPTGGGKSLCYQVPPLVGETMDVVVSPLISLMKDQVDGLNANGYSAAALHSGLSPAERREVERGVAEGQYRLLFVAPERMVGSWFMNVAKQVGVKRFAIDEAHCISQWGHDFRPEYRQLALLRHKFPEASIHAFTATATPRVREDIVNQLTLRDPAVLVGIFDRANLIYRIVPQVDRYKQIIEVVRRRAGEAAIVYCISRNDTESTAATLKANGIKASHYHAGMTADQRRNTQEDFIEERLDVVVATVAFGMGIDRSNVRCVIHAAMPKTIEGYQQETGRAGRDGLEAECVMLYSPGDVFRWEGLIRMSAQNADDPAEVVAAQTVLLRTMQNFASSMVCRHKALSEYFGQTYDKPNCGACDVCLGDTEGVEDATVIAQKILSCVARVEQRFGLGHVVDVLQGANTEMIRRCNHERLSTYGLLRDMDKKELQSMAYQLIEQGVLVRTEGDRPLLQLNEESMAVMRGKRQVQLVRPRKKTRSAAVGQADMEGVDRPLLDHLRAWRRRLAQDRGLPPYVVFGDATLIELARVRPTRPESLRLIHGIGDKRMADFGGAILNEIADFAKRHELTTDEADRAEIVVVKGRKPNAVKDTAFAMFVQRKEVEDIARETGRAVSTTYGYLEEFIASHKPERIDCWVDDATYRRVREVAMTMESSQLRPIFDALGGEVPFEKLRIVLTHLGTQG